MLRLVGAAIVLVFFFSLVGVCWFFCSRMHSFLELVALKGIQCFCCLAVAAVPLAAVAVLLMLLLLLLLCCCCCCVVASC